MVAFGNIPLERAALECTYEDTLELLRPTDITQNNITHKVPVAAGESICALSQGGGGPATQTDTFALVEYDAKIYAPPELDVQEGDAIRLVRFGRQNPASPQIFYFEPVGRPALYPTHQEIPVKVREKA